MLIMQLNEWNETLNIIGIYRSLHADEITDRSMTNGADSIVLEAEYENAANFSVGATTDNLPPGVLYRVKATYKYSREDVDELSFDVGEIIRVVEYDDPEEQVGNFLNK